jgi:hypothetical protein
MPTKRTRRARTSTLLPEHLAWAQSEDAEAFFDRTGSYDLYGAVSKLPGVRPWWESLKIVWRRRDAGPPADTAGTVAHTSWPEALAFLKALHGEYVETHR